MPQYGGGDKGEAAIVQNASAQKLQLQLAKAKALSGIGEGLSEVGQGLSQKRAMAHQTEMQKTAIAGQSALSAQESTQQMEQQGYGAYLRGEAQPAGAAPGQGTAAPAAPGATGVEGPPTPPPQNLPGQVATTRGSGAYAPTQATKEGAFQRSQLVGSEVYSNMAKVDAQKKITEAHLKQMDLETGIKRDESERKAYDSQSKIVEDLFRGEASAAEHVSLIDTVKDPQASLKMKTLQGVIDASRARREAEGIKYAAATGDTTFLVPGGPAEKELAQWKDPARAMLNASPSFQSIVRRKGGLYAAKAVNRFAATLHIMAAQNPAMQQAAALAFVQEEQLKGGGGGGAPGVQGSTQPGR